MKWLDRLHKKTLDTGEQEVPKVPEARFGAFATSEVLGSQVFWEASIAPRIADRYPPDELGDSCPACGGEEQWIWLDGRTLCRSCLIREDPGDANQPRSSDQPSKRRDNWTFGRPHR